MATPPPAPSIPITRTIYFPTPIAYDKWASTYDHDGNVLQLLDDNYILTTALPLLTHLLSTHPPSTPLRALDLGCGTGRNTQKLLSTNLFPSGSITGLDASAGMLSVARTRLPSHVNLLQRDILTDTCPPAQIARCTPVIICTLVLEHLPLDACFRFISSCLLPLPEKGYVILTNMHSEMGAVSQAGFNIEEGGKRTKVRTENMYNYSVAEIVEGARRMVGLEVVGDVVEVGVEEGDVERLGVRSSKWVGKKLLVGMVFTRGGGA